jgi:hypothetical protein
LKSEIISTALAEASIAEGHRCGALGSITAGIEGLAGHVRDYVAARDKLIAEARTAYSACPSDAALRADVFAGWMGQIAEARAEKELIRAALAEAGFSVFGFNFEESAVRKRDTGKENGELTYELATRTRRFLDTIAPSDTAEAP